MNSAGWTHAELAGGFDFRVHSISGKLSQEDERERLNGPRYVGGVRGESNLRWLLIKVSSKASGVRYRLAVSFFRLAARGRCGSAARRACTYLKQRRKNERVTRADLGVASVLVPIRKPRLGISETKHQPTVNLNFPSPFVREKSDSINQPRRTVREP